MTQAQWPAMSLGDAHALLTAQGSPFEMTTVVIAGRETRTWLNPPHTFAEVFAASQAFPERDFLVLDGERASFEAFGKAVRHLAARLQQDGVEKGDRVAVVMRNLPEWPVAFFAASLAGGIVTPLNAWWTGPELAYGLKDSGAKAVVVDAERFERLAARLHDFPDIVSVYVARSEEPIAHPLVRRLETVIGGVADWANLHQADFNGPELHPDDPATIFYTSGTTGNPKGAIGSHRAGSAAILAGAFSSARASVRRGETPPSPLEGPQKAALVSIPFFHVTGCFALLFGLMMVGGKAVLMRRWDAEEALALIEKERVTLAGGVPTVAWELLEHPDRARYDLSSLDTFTYGGAPSAPELAERLRAAFPRSSPGMGWGMTETSATVTHHSGEDYLSRPLSCGPAIPVCDLKITDADGAELPVGVAGELWARGPVVVMGYWNRPESTAQTFVDGWVRTGDLARLDEEGFLYIVDRAKDVIIRGGENIYSVEVENALMTHPAVADAALVGVPHRTLGEVPAAVVTLAAGKSVSEIELKAWVAERLAAFKTPVEVRILGEPLPRNLTGKVRKPELRALFAPRG